MTNLRLIADDLTGALDSGCAFASNEATVRIGLPWQPLPIGPRIAVSTDTRDKTEAASSAAVIAAMDRLAPDGDAQTLWFKKIDSVMRGHPVAETAAVFTAGGFRHCVFAPAFPQMGRVTAGGRQYVEGLERRQVGPDFIAAFAAFGLAAAIREFGPEDQQLAPLERDVSISLVDADTQETLALRVEALRRRDAAHKSLWVGTGGLAAALSGRRCVQAVSSVHSVVVGTNHAVTLGQIDHALAAGLFATSASGPRADTRPALVAPSLTSRHAEETSDRLRRLIPGMTFSDPAKTTIMVIGGDTLSTVLQSVGATFLECIGEAATGVPVCRVHGGGWHGVTLLSKSGGFGGQQLLTQLIAAR